MVTKDSYQTVWTSLVDPINDIFTDIVHAPGLFITYFESISLHTNEFAWFGSEALECIIGYWLLTYLFFLLITFPFAVWFAWEDVAQ